jgi:hypothetical protein
VLGAEAGLAAIAYNRALLETLAAAERLGRLSVELRAGLIGAAVGTLAWFAPNVVGFGDAITQRSLAGAETLSVLSVGFSTPLLARHGIIRRRNTRRALRTHARVWRSSACSLGFDFRCCAGSVQGCEQPDPPPDSLQFLSPCVRYRTKVISWNVKVALSTGELGEA